MRSASALAAVIVALSVAGDALADDRTAMGGRFALEVGGVRHGTVKAIEGQRNGARELVVIATDVGAPLVALASTFTQGKIVKKDLRLTSGAVMRKANDARLATIKLPALGSGGAADIELGFITPSITTQPLLSAVSAKDAPSAAKITSFRLAVSGMETPDVPKLDAITIAQSADGRVTTSEVAIEAGPGGAPPFVKWEKRPTPRSVQIEYVSPDGKALLNVQLDRCTPASVKPLGASGTTRVTLSCAELRTS